VRLLNSEQLKTFKKVKEIHASYSALSISGLLLFQFLLSYRQTVRTSLERMPIAESLRKINDPNTQTHIRKPVKKGEARVQAGFLKQTKLLQVMGIDLCERTVSVQAENVKKLVRMHFTCLYNARETIPLGSDSKY